MKNLILLNVIFFTSLISCNNFTKEKSIKAEFHGGVQDTMSMVEEIKGYRDELKFQQNDLDTLTKDLYESAEGGRVKLFFKEMDTLKKEFIYYGETGKRELNIYQRSNIPVLIEDVSYEYEKPIYASKKASIKAKKTDMYYLNHSLELIYWISNGTHISPKLYDDQESEIKLLLE